MTRDIAIACPICHGKCKSEDGQECKPCGGKGILWGKETDDVTVPPIFVPVPYPSPYPNPYPNPCIPPIWYGGDVAILPLLPAPLIVTC